MRSYLQKWKKVKNKHDPKHWREFQSVHNYKWRCVSKEERRYSVWWSFRNANWNLISPEKLFATFWITEQLWLLIKPIKRLKLTSPLSLKEQFTQKWKFRLLTLILSQTRMTSLLSGRCLAACVYSSWGIPVNVLMILNEHCSLFFHATWSQTFKGMHSFLPLTVNHSFHCSKVVSRRSQQDNNQV